jgi:hypothetical protein
MLGPLHMFAKRCKTLNVKTEGYLEQSQCITLARDQVCNLRHKSRSPALSFRGLPMTPHVHVASLQPVGSIRWLHYSPVSFHRFLVMQPMLLLGDYKHGKDIPFEALPRGMGACSQKQSLGPLSLRRANTADN